MTLKFAYNTTDSAVLVDEQGHTIGGRGWGGVDTTDPIAQAELDSGRIILSDEDAAAGSDNDDAKIAVEALGRRRERVEAAKALSKQELADQLDESELDAMEAGSDGLPHKDDLVDAVVADDEAEQSKTTKTTKPRRGQ